MSEVRQRKQAPGSSSNSSDSSNAAMAGGLEFNTGRVCLSTPREIAAVILYGPVAWYGGMDGVWIRRPLIITIIPNGHGI